MSHDVLSLATEYSVPLKSCNPTWTSHDWMAVTFRFADVRHALHLPRTSSREGKLQEYAWDDSNMQGGRNGSWSGYVVVLADCLYLPACATPVLDRAAVRCSAAAIEFPGVSCRSCWKLWRR